MIIWIYVQICPTDSNFWFAWHYTLFGCLYYMKVKRLWRAEYVIFIRLISRHSTGRSYLEKIPENIWIEHDTASRGPVDPWLVFVLCGWQFMCALKDQVTWHLQLDSSESCRMKVWMAICWMVIQKPTMMLR